MYKFKLTVTDSSGQTDSTVVTVLVLTPEQSEGEFGDRSQSTEGCAPQPDDSTACWVRQLGCYEEEVALLLPARQSV